MVVKSTARMGRMTPVAKKTVVKRVCCQKDRNPRPETLNPDFQADVDSKPELEERFFHALLAQALDAFRVSS